MSMDEYWHPNMGASAAKQLPAQMVGTPIHEKIVAMTVCNGVVFVATEHQVFYVDDGSLKAVRLAADPA